LRVRQMIRDNHDIIVAIPDAFFWDIVLRIEKGDLNFFLLVLLTRTMKV
jgi:hypothetical protein